MISKKKKKYRYSPLLNEAIEITNDLGNVTFIGAVAVFLHTNVHRASQDLDFIIDYDITEDQLQEKGYIKYEDRKNGYSTPRKTLIVDIYRNEHISGIPIKTIIETAEIFTLSSKRDRVNVIKAVKLEVLILMKFKAGRTQDISDLEALALNSLSEIDWEYLRGITDDDFQYDRIRTTMQM